MPFQKEWHHILLANSFLTINDRDKRITKALLLQHTRASLLLAVIIIVSAKMMQGDKEPL